MSKEKMFYKKSLAKNLYSVIAASVRIQEKYVHDKKKPH